MLLHSQVQSRMLLLYLNGSVPRLMKIFSSLLQEIEKFLLLLLRISNLKMSQLIPPKLNKSLLTFSKPMDSPSQMNNGFISPSLLKKMVKLITNLCWKSLKKDCISYMLIPKPMSFNHNFLY